MKLNDVITRDGKHYVAKEGPVFGVGCEGCDLEDVDCQTGFELPPCFHVADADIVVFKELK